MSEEKRRAVRLSPFVVACKVTRGEAQLPAFITELSALGARVTCDDDCPPVGSRVVIEVRLARRAVAPARLSAAVVWAGKAARGPAFGVEFDELTEAQARALAQAVEEFRSLAEKIN